jgi:hypothetical protein
MQETGKRPEPNSLGLLPSGPDPICKWLVRRQPPTDIYQARTPLMQVLLRDFPRCLQRPLVPCQSHARR